MNNVPVEVTGISIFTPYQGFVVILKEIEGERVLPIYIGPTEAHNISLLLQGVKYIRPLTYDLFHNLLATADSRIDNVVITDLRDSTFYAEVSVKVQSAIHRVDARPSDAIALAIKSKAPISVNPKVLNEAGLIGDVTPEPPDLNRRIHNLNRQLDDAVEVEAYEEAARIRDAIRSLEVIQGSS